MYLTLSVFTKIHHLNSIWFIYIILGLIYFVVILASLV